MLANNQTEGNPQTPTGATEQPTSSTSGAQGQPLPDYVTALQGQIEQLSGLVKGLQKGTDKQIGQVRGDIKRILELGGKGLDETGIQRELFLDQLMSGQSTTAQIPAGSGQQPGAGLDVDSMVTALQFQPNDPALAALKIKYMDNPKELVKAAADLRLSQLQTPNPSPGTGLSQQSGQTVTGGITPQEAEQLSIKLNRLYDNYSANKPQIETIEKQLKGFWEGNK